jgi:hypothetical protein
MEIIIYIFAIYGLAFAIKESDGPWGVMALIRNKLMQNKHVGVFCYKLLDCYFCLGCHCGWIIYLLSAKEWHLNLLICWSLAGGVISLILDAVLTRLSNPQG